VTTPLVFGDIVVVGSVTAGLVGIRVTRTGGSFAAERAWTIASMPINYSSLVPVGSCAYGLGPMDSLVCVNPRDSEKRKVQEGFFSGTMRTGFAGFIAMGNNILALTDGGWLMRIAAIARRLPGDRAREVLRPELVQPRLRGRQALPPRRQQPLLHRDRAVGGRPPTPI